MQMHEYTGMFRPQPHAFVRKQAQAAGKLAKNDSM